MDYRKAAHSFISGATLGSITEFSEHFAKFGRGENLVLGVIAKLHGCVQPGRIAQESGLGSARIAAVLGALERKGLIIRSHDGQDRRHILVTLTDEGRKLAGRRYEKMLDTTARIFERMGEGDTQDFIRTHRRFIEILGQTIPKQTDEENI